jgi:hypothetical protein
MYQVCLGSLTAAAAMAPGYSSSAGTVREGVAAEEECRKTSLLWENFQRQQEAGVLSAPD